ncbi:MAG: N-acetylneuraminate synthase family protein [Candidatus Omnitrophota bacterium]
MIEFKKINRPYLIAEIGINHNSDLGIAKRLIDAVFACQWDCVKFQKKTPDLCVPRGQKNVIKDTPWGRMAYLEYKRRLEFGKKEYDYIDNYCKEKPLDWTASVWDMPSLEFIMNYDVPFIKIPSAKLADKHLLRAACETGKAVILSTGMSTLKEIDGAVKILERYSSEHILMHTNSTYPSDYNDLNLQCILTLQKRYNCPVGYSGHEYDLEPTVVAAALGAKVIERHITLDHKMWGTDHSSSLEVMGMDILKKRINSIYAIFGDGKKRITQGEILMRKKMRSA